MIDESTIKPLVESKEDPPICRYCHGHIMRSQKTPTLWYCPACGMYQTIENDPELRRYHHG